MSTMWWRLRRRSPSDGLIGQQVGELSRKLALFEQAVAAAGLHLESAAGDTVPGVSPALIAATRCYPRPGGEPVSLEAAGVPLIAVVGGDGDPAAWQAALAELAGPACAAPAGTVRIGQRALPAGLRAVARGGTGTAVWTSAALAPGERAAAGRAALRAARRYGWHTRAPAAVAVAAGAAWEAVKAHAAGLAVAGSAAGIVAAGISMGMVIALAPAHSPAPAPRPGAPASTHRRAVPPVSRRAPVRHHHRRKRAAGALAIGAHGGHFRTPGGLTVTVSPPSPGTLPVPVPSPPVTVPVPACVKVPPLNICA